MRGRKSKYLNEIDMEDDEEATYEQRKVDEENLEMIREEDEEEITKGQ